MIGAIGGVLLLWVDREARPGMDRHRAAARRSAARCWIGSGTLLDGPLFIPVILIGAITDRHRARGGDLDHQHLLPERGALDRRRLGQLHGQVRRGRRADPRRLLVPRPTSRRVLDGYLFTALCLAGVVLGLLVLSVFARRVAGRAGRASARPTPTPHLPEPRA